MNRGDGGTDPPQIIGRELQDSDFLIREVLLVANVLIASNEQIKFGVAWRNSSPLVIPPVQVQYIGNTAGSIHR